MDKKIYTAPAGCVFVKSGSHRSDDKIRRTGIKYISLYNMGWSRSAGTSMLMINEKDYGKIKDIKSVGKPSRKLPALEYEWHARQAESEDESLRKKYNETNKMYMAKGGQIGKTSKIVKDITSIDHYVDFSVRGNSHEVDYDKAASILNDSYYYLSDKELFEKYGDVIGAHPDEDEFDENGRMEEFRITDHYAVNFKDGSRAVLDFSWPSDDARLQDVYVDEDDEDKMAGKYKEVFEHDGWDMSIDEIEEKVNKGKMAKGGSVESRISVLEKAMNSPMASEAAKKAYKEAIEKLKSQKAEGGSVGESSLVYEKWSRDNGGDGVSGTVRVSPENYWVGTVDKDGNLKIDSWEKNEKALKFINNPDSVIKAWKSGLIKEKVSKHAEGGMAGDSWDGGDESESLPGDERFFGEGGQVKGAERNKMIYKYVIDAIDASDRGLDKMPETDKEKIEFLWKTFISEYGWNVKRMGTQRAFVEWLQGLPSAFNVDYENYRIIEIGKEWGILKPDATDKQEGKFLETWWARIYMGLRAAARKNKVELSTAGVMAKGGKLYGGYHSKIDVSKFGIKDGKPYTFSDFLTDKGYTKWYLSQKPIKFKDEAGSKRITHKQYGALESEYAKKFLDKKEKGGSIGSGDQVNITDSKSLYKGKSGYIVGEHGKKSWTVKVMVDGKETNCVVSKKGARLVMGDGGSVNSFTVAGRKFTLKGKNVYEGKTLYSGPHDNLQGAKRSVQNNISKSKKGLNEYLS